MNFEEARTTQEKNLLKLKESNPEMLEIKHRRKEADVFKEIGIWNLPPDRSKGYLRYYNEDFVVEEKTQKDTKVLVDKISREIPTEPEDKQKNLYAHMFKTGISTNTAIDRVRECLGVRKQIGIAGLKDEQAITGQLISLPAGRPPIQEMLDAKIPDVGLSDFQYHDGYLRPGYLEGNIFTILVRTEEPVNEAVLNARLNTINKFGILNYYQSQRFGGVRLQSHLIGKLMLQGKFELAIRYILFKTNDFEMPIIRELKKAGESHYSNIDKVIEYYSKLPFSFYYELRLLEYLKTNPEDYIGALRAIKESSTICIYAYASLLFNKYLSEYSRQNGCVDEIFPLLISPDRQDQLIYQKYLKEDGTENFYENIKKLGFIYINKRTVPGRVPVNDINYRIVPEGLVITFFLGKGSYATTFLANLFELSEGEPTPAWVNQNPVDPLKALGRPGLEQVCEILN